MRGSAWKRQKSGAINLSVDRRRTLPAERVEWFVKHVFIAKEDVEDQSDMAVELRVLHVTQREELRPEVCVTVLPEVVHLCTRASTVRMALWPHGKC